jgi:hypothetical protein
MKYAGDKCSFKVLRKGQVLDVETILQVLPFFPFALHIIVFCRLTSCGGGDTARRVAGAEAARLRFVRVVLHRGRPRLRSPLGPVPARMVRSLVAGQDALVPPLALRPRRPLSRTAPSPFSFLFFSFPLTFLFLFDLFLFDFFRIRRRKGRSRW